jgi:hypothetical protein
MFQSVFNFDLFPIQAGIKRVYCNASGISVKDYICKLKLIKEGAIVSMGFEVTKEVTDMSVKKYQIQGREPLPIFLLSQVSATADFKMFNHWRQIVNVPWINMCDVFTSDNNFIRTFVESWKYFLPSLPWACPIKPGRYDQNNVTIIDLNTWKGEEDDHFFKTVINLPNGIFRINIFFMRPNEPNLALFQYFYEIKRRLNDDKF